MENSRANQVILLKSTNDFCISTILLALLQYFFLYALIQLKNTSFSK